MELPFYKIESTLLLKMSDSSWFTHARLFDNLLIVANAATACFVLKTSEGLIVIDAIYPKEEMFQAICEAIRDTGWAPEEIRKLVLTHGHFDHCGCGRWIKEAFHAESYLSQTDDRFWEEHPFMAYKKETLKDYEIDHYVSDGDTISLGDTEIRVLLTPGHTPGGLSFLFPVYENGEQHMAGMWGGSNPPQDLSGVSSYLRSLEYFLERARREHCDVILCNHPGMDSYSKIEYARTRCSHLPNVYIIGEDGFGRFCTMYRRLCYDKLDELAGKAARKGWDI